MQYTVSTPKGNSFRRSGLVFSDVAMIVDSEDIGSERMSAILAEPMLSVVPVISIPVPESKPNDFEAARAILSPVPPEPLNTATDKQPVIAESAKSELPMSSPSRAIKPAKRGRKAKRNRV